MCGENSFSGILRFSQYRRQDDAHRKRALTVSNEWLIDLTI